MLSSLVIVALMYLICMKFVFLPRCEDESFDTYLYRTVFNSKLIGVSVFFLSSPLLSFILGPTICADGWNSPSIGLPGACSHHGGVDIIKDFLGFASAVILGVISWGKVREIKKKKKDSTYA